MKFPNPKKSQLMREILTSNLIDGVLRKLFLAK